MSPRERGAIPCPHCGGDLLRPTFAPRPYCHGGAYVTRSILR